MASAMWHNSIPGWIPSDPNYQSLSSGERHALQQLANLCDSPRDGCDALLGCVGGERLQDQCGCSRSTLRRHINKLMEYHFAVKLSNGGGWCANTYGVPSFRGQLDKFEAKKSDKARRWQRNDAPKIRELLVVQNEPLREGEPLVVQNEPLRGGEPLVVQNEPLRGGELLVVQNEPLRGGELLVVQNEPLRGGEPLVVQNEPAGGSKRTSRGFKMNQQGVQNEPLPSSSKRDSISLPSSKSKCQDRLCSDDDEREEQLTDRFKLPAGSTPDEIKIELCNAGVDAGRAYKLAHNSLTTPAMVREVISLSNGYATSNHGAYVGGLMDDAIADARQQQKRDRDSQFETAQEMLSGYEDSIDELPDNEIQEAIDSQSALRGMTFEVARKDPVFRKEIARWLMHRQENDTKARVKFA
ncbi:MAG: hypothetical protein IH984_09545 [Planctomycetes bacterium]|nr:hypothetical protein [Planctomycetota bacterium]